ncbi:hypothetical protein [Flavobacterium sp.]|jgi:hypothetical protein|uniref:hypothetical protein n=1 Tax=Flavobacterium sp. TaxID=239 RepID=UPI0037BFCE1B
MKKIIFYFLIFTTCSFAQSKDCIFEVNEETDSTYTKVLPEKFIYESVFGSTTRFLSFKLYNIDGIMGLNIQYVQKSMNFLTSTCIDKDTKIYLQLSNGKEVKLINSLDQETCNSLNIDPVSKNNIRVLNGYFNFTKENFEYLKTEKVYLVRIVTITGEERFIINSELKSEINKETTHPDQFFIEYLPCFGI